MTDLPAPPASPSAAVPRPAATLVIVRDAANGLEVLLLRRAERGSPESGSWVFPGGTVDRRDREAHACCAGLDDAQASQRLGLAEGGLDYHVAALRECYEECGLLFCEPVPAHAEADTNAWRTEISQGRKGMLDLCQASGVWLRPDALAYFSHWLTPLGRPRRWDTRFFVAQAPAGQDARADGQEMDAHRWIRPAEAVATAEALKLMNPTRITLQAISAFPDTAALMAHARAPRRVPLIMPRVAMGRQGPRPVMPQEHAWAEIGRLDPQGHGHARYDIEPGRPVRLSPRVLRLTAGNAGVMTGPGTNTYLVGREGGPCAVIDPGPEDAAHLEAMLAAAPGPIRWILATHTHRDHSPGAVALAARTKAEVLGQVARFSASQDESFAPHRVLQGGERIEIDEDITLTALHTPGHASNHLCYRLEEEKTLFTGDHVMQASTVVINPPDGDMAAYVASLQGLLDLDLEWLAPGHGFLMARPREAFEWIIDHRLRREAKVVDALRALGPEADDTALLARVYDDVAPHLHPPARRSLQAHLLKLRDEGRAAEREGRWSLLAATPL